MHQMRQWRELLRFGTADFSPRFVAA